MNLKWKISLVLAEVAAIFVAARRSYADSPPTITHDVAFKVGTNAQINWFEIDNPSVGGVIDVANQPYPNSHDLNAAVLDVSRNRLIYVDETGGNSAAYAIDLTGITLLPNATTSVNVAFLGDWPGGKDNAGYSKADGRIYYHIYNSIQLNYLNFDSSGNISGSMTVGTLNGPGFITTAITAGDLAFDSTGEIWISGINDNSDNRLWNFDPATLTVMAIKNPTRVYAGITFDAAGTQLYGYVAATGEYGIIDESTGNFQTVLDTDASVFGNLGDLAEGIETIAVPEPSSTALMLTALLAIVACRRVRSRREERDHLTGQVI